MEIQRLMYSSGQAFFQQWHPFHLVEQILTVAKINTKPAMSMLPNKIDEDVENRQSSIDCVQKGKLFLTRSPKIGWTHSRWISSTSTQLVLSQVWLKWVRWPRSGTIKSIPWCNTGIRKIRAAQLLLVNCKESEVCSITKSFPPKGSLCFHKGIIR